MQVEVYHDEVHVATVNTPHEFVSEALEYAWRWTQNINGSWSRPNNADSNDSVVVHAALPTHNGRILGLRSSMIGDTFRINGRSWMVSSFGFTPMGSL